MVETYARVALPKPPTQTGKFAGFGEFFQREEFDSKSEVIFRELPNIGEWTAITKLASSVKEGYMGEILLEEASKHLVVGRTVSIGITEYVITYVEGNIIRLNKPARRQFGFHEPVRIMFLEGEIPQIEDVDNPVVGEWYMVPTARGGDAIIPSCHTDEDHFNCTQEHYHWDTRFTQPTAEYMATWSSVSWEHKPQKCIRDTPSDWANFGRMILATISLYLDFWHVKAKCQRCPHKGMPIHNGVCTGHRLKWKDDGSCKHLGPFTIKVRRYYLIPGRPLEEPFAELTLSKMPEDGSLRFDITRDVSVGQILIALYDRDGNLVRECPFEKDLGHNYVAGDVLILHQNC